MPDHGTLALMIPILAIGGGLAIPIVAMMIKHQQRMAEMIQQNGQASVDPRIDALQRDVADLKDLVHQQTIVLDRLSTPLPNAEIRERIGG